jgi:MFS family permease
VTPGADSSAAPGADSSVFDPEYRAAMIAIVTTVALSAFEGLAVAAALPQVAADLGNVSLLPWVLTTFLLVAGVATVVAGALVDRFGVGPVFRVAVGVFTLGGLAAAMAPSIEVLIAARVLQGIGGGATNAVALAAVGLVFPPKLVGRAFALNATVWGVMSVAGPGIAAALLAVASWRWIFWVNLPLGLLALWLGWRTLPDRPPASSSGAVRSRIDLVALGLLTVFSVGSLIAFDQLAWTSLPALVVALLAGAAVMRRTRGQADALIAPRHVLDAPLGPLGWTIALLLIGGIGTQLYVPLYVTAGRGVGASLGAWSVMFFTLGWTTGAQISSRLMDARGPLRVTTIGATMVAPACVVVGVLAFLEAPLWLVFAALVIAGAGVGTSTNSALTLLRQLAPDAELGRATAAHQYIRSQGFAGGSALGGAVLLLVVATQTGNVEAVRSLLERSGDVAIDPAVAAAVQEGFATAVLVCASVAALAHLPLRAVRRAARAASAADDDASAAAANIGQSTSG